LILAGNTQDYVITIARINQTIVINNRVVIAPSAKDYVVTIVGIKRTVVNDALSTPQASVWVPSAKDYVVASKSISNASIQYSFHPNRGNNIILLSKC
jgi:hypothetical protein